MEFRDKQHTLWMSVLAVFLVAAIGVGSIQGHTGTDIAHAHAKCRAVSGSISANVVNNPAVSTGLALGTVTGDLAGATLATFTATPSSNGSLSLVLHHNFVTDARNSLATEDTGTLIPVPGLDNVFRMSVDYTITGGTGKFAHATGSLHNHGEADLNTGLLTLTYSGQVCHQE